MNWAVYQNARQLQLISTRSITSPAMSQPHCGISQHTRRQILCHVTDICAGKADRSLLQQQPGAHAQLMPLQQAYRGIAYNSWLTVHDAIGCRVGHGLCGRDHHPLPGLPRGARLPSHVLPHGEL